MRTSLAILILFLCACSQQPERPPKIIWLNAEDISPSWGAYGIPDDSTKSGFNDFMYNAFTGWTLEEAVRGCGVELKPKFLG